MKTGAPLYVSTPHFLHRHFHYILNIAGGKEKCFITDILTCPVLLQCIVLSSKMVPVTSGFKPIWLPGRLKQLCSWSRIGNRLLFLLFHRSTAVCNTLLLLFSHPLSFPQQTLSSHFSEDSSLRNKGGRNVGRGNRKGNEASVDPPDLCQAAF